ncbi:Transcriptional regulator CBF1 [Grifola frondosa]|uniref:Transcriptional regulator CBF1 n=1 Tax=Grifola frondosa TaxID=5627 RepID=A0A1C7MCL3_GRIFR|nr:Transcriptional regulator CBF1 [Grifola frondosa]
MASTQPNHDPALANANAPPPPQNAPPIGTGASAEVTAQLLPQLATNEVLALLKTIPGLRGGDLKDSAAAEALSNLSQAGFMQQHPQHLQQPHPGHFQHVVHPHQMPHPDSPVNLVLSHPRGPPNLGQLSAAATALQSTSSPPQPSAMRAQVRRVTMDKEMTVKKMRKDNHKEVERRRRGNINEGINELGRIVPNGSGEKAKGAILSRAVQYIHHLKENEARNIEKWTLEKLLMDQAMGDLQAQLEEMRRMWEEERMARQRADSELEVLRGVQGPPGASGVAPTSASPAAPTGSSAPAPAPAPPAPVEARPPESAKEKGKREREESDTAHAEEGGQRTGEAER